jgi:hypothetical protein
MPFRGGVDLDNKSTILSEDILSIQVLLFLAMVFRWILKPSPTVGRNTGTTS